MRYNAPAVGVFDRVNAGPPAHFTKEIHLMSVRKPKAPTAAQANKATNKRLTVADKQTTATAETERNVNNSAIILVTMLSVSELHPSGWNPNVMSEAEYRAYVQEVQILGKIPKPIVVIRVENGYLIVDGEHAWKAATEAGFTEVPCEVIDVDRFEAMRQTLARNRHGENNPVLLGCLYELMGKERKLSNRKLADQLGVSEGTIRNHRDYAKAAKLRNRYAPEGADELISGLNTKQVAAYLSLKDKGNEWLDAGAKLAHVEQLIALKSNVKEIDSSATAAGS